MMYTPKSMPLLICLGLALAAPAEAASDCQPVFDAYAAQMKMPAVKRTVTMPGMADPAEMILDSWGKIEIDEAARAVMKKGTPAPETVSECRRIGPSAVDGVSGTAYEFTPPKMSGNAPGEKITVLLDDKTGLPVRETALKAGTKVTIVFDGVTAPLP